MNYTGSFSLNSLGLGQSGLMQAYQTGMTAQSDATGYKPFAYNPDSGKVRRPRQGDPAVDSFQRYLEASMANNLPSYPLSNPFNHAAHYRNVVYTAVSSMMRVLSSASIRLEIKRDGSGGMASVAGDSRDHDYIPFNDHYLSDFLRSPNPADDFASFLGKCILQYHLTGRLLIWGVPNKWGLPVRFYVLPTALCIPNPGVPTDRYPMGAWRVQNYYPSSGMVGILPGPAAGIASTPGALIDAREIYVMNNPHPLFNWASLSGLDAMGVQTDVVEMMDKAFWSVYRQGPRIAGILTAPGATADQIDDLNSAINSTYAGPDNAGKIWTTGGRVDAPSFTPISLGPEQLDITARATYEAQIIAAVTGQDRTVLGLKTDGVGSYSERWAAMADVRERTYIPWLGMLASMLTRGPVRDWGLEDKGVRVAIRLPRLNDPVMVQADTNAGAADGTMTTDEVRARRDMGPDPLGLGHLPPAIRTMTLQLAAEQGGLPPNPTPPGDDGSEETVDIADPSDDGTALGALRASREEPEGEPIAPTAQVNAMRQQQAKPAKGNKPPAKPGAKGKGKPGGKGKAEKKALPENPEHRTEAVHGLHLALQADPLNHGLRQVYADALDDAGATYEATVHRAIATQDYGAFHSGTTHEQARTASYIAEELSADAHGHSSRSGTVHRGQVPGGYGHQHASRALAAAENGGDSSDIHDRHNRAVNAHESGESEHKRLGAAFHNDPTYGEEWHARGEALHGLAKIAHIVARSAYYHPPTREVKSDLAQSAFTDSLGGTLVPEAGSATVATLPKKKRRILRGHQAHEVIERAVAEVLGVATPAVEAKAELADPPSDPDPQKAALRAMEPRAKKGFHAHMADLYRGEEPLMHEHLADDDSRLDHFHDYLNDEHQIRVRPDGLVTFHEATKPVKRIIGDLPVMLYHHTSDAIDSKVQQEGLKVRRGKVASPHLNSSAGVYITTEYSGPAVRGYHENARQFHGGKYRTWGVRTHLHELTPDPDDADISSGRYQYIVPHVHPHDLIDLDHGVKAFADPDPTPAFDRYAAHRKHLAELPVVHAEPLGNPVDHSNVSHVLTLQHPRRQIKAVFKPSEGEQPGLRQHIPMHAGAQAARESAASHVAEIAGYHDLVPATTLRHHERQHGSVQRFVGDGILAAKLGNDERFGSNHADVRRAAAFDYLIGNTDRHMGNWLVRPTPHGDKLALIDHGLAFPERHPDGREAYNFEIMRHAMYHKPTRGEPAPNPGGSDPDGKWLAIRRTLTEHGLSSKAIADTGKRWRVLTSGRFHFGDLLSEHPDDLLAKLNTTPATRTGV